MRKVKFLIFSSLVVLMACGSSSQWTKIEKYFSEKSVKSEHFVPKPLDAFEKSEAYTSAATLDSIYLQMLEAEYRGYPAKGAFRFNIDGKNAWGLICYRGPGEASGDWETVLLPFDKEKGEYGPWILLSNQTQDCEIDINESWLQDLDNNGTIDILTRNLIYAIPDPGGEYCIEGRAPKFSYEVREWKNGQYEKSDMKVDLKAFKMAAEPTMQKAFLSSGNAAMLPR